MNKRKLAKAVRVFELADAVVDIKRRKLAEKDREHPSEHYIQGLQFELARLKADHAREEE